MEDRLKRAVAAGKRSEADTARGANDISPRPLDAGTVVPTDMVAGSSSETQGKSSFYAWVVFATISCIVIIISGVVVWVIFVHTRFESATIPNGSAPNGKKKLADGRYKKRFLGQNHKKSRSHKKSRRKRSAKFSNSKHIAKGSDRVDAKSANFYDGNNQSHETSARTSNQNGKTNGSNTQAGKTSRSKMGAGKMSGTKTQAGSSGAKENEANKSAAEYSDTHPSAPESKVEASEDMAASRRTTGGGYKYALKVLGSVLTSASILVGAIWAGIWNGAAKKRLMPDSTHVSGSSTVPNSNTDSAATHEPASAIVPQAPIQPISESFLAPPLSAPTFEFPPLRSLGLDAIISLLASDGPARLEQLIASMAASLNDGAAANPPASASHSPMLRDDTSGSVAGSSEATPHKSTRSLDELKPDELKDDYNAKYLMVMSAFRNFGAQAYPTGVATGAARKIMESHPLYRRELAFAKFIEEMKVISLSASDGPEPPWRQEVTKLTESQEDLEAILESNGNRMSVQLFKLLRTLATILLLGESSELHALATLSQLLLDRGAETLESEGVFPKLEDIPLFKIEFDEFLECDANEKRKKRSAMVSLKSEDERWGSLQWDNFLGGGRIHISTFGKWDNRHGTLPAQNHTWISFDLWYTRRRQLIDSP